MYFLFTEDFKKYLNISSNEEIDHLLKYLSEDIIQDENMISQEDIQRLCAEIDFEEEIPEKLPPTTSTTATAATTLLLLFRYILKNYNISWDNKGTFKYKNKIVPNSNILHLVTHTLLRNIEDKPPGMKLFYEALSDVNVPEYLIANKMGKLVIAGRGDELTGKPSGKLDTK